MVQCLFSSFESTESGLSMLVDGLKKGEVKSSNLAKAFAGVYLDDKAVAPSLRSDIAKTVLTWVK